MPSPTPDRPRFPFRARHLSLLIAGAVLLLGAIGAALPGEQLPPPPPPPAPPAGPAQLDTLALLRTATRGPDGRLHATLPDGRAATLTIDPALQLRVEKLLAERPVPYGVSVASEPSTGRILALVEHSRAEPSRAAGLAGKPMSPAASVFKVVTAAALLEQGVAADENVCFHGGKHRIRPALLKDSPRDRRCMTLADAMGHSANVAFAKLADRKLTPELLKAEADKLLFNAPLAVDGSVLEASPAAIPEDPFAFATAAAGFSEEVRLTPLHGAVLAAAVANGGVAMPLTLLDAIDGEPVERRPGTRLFSPEVARDLGTMLEKTVAEGTARRAFAGRRLPAVGAPAAGKTGSLHEQEPFRDHTWFVGYAPVEAPEVAVSTVIVNERIWHVKAPHVARETLRFALDAVEAARTVRTAGPGAGQGHAAPN